MSETEDDSVGVSIFKTLKGGSGISPFCGVPANAYPPMSHQSIGRVWHVFPIGDSDITFGKRSEVQAMKYQTIGMNERKRIALVAHDNKKPDLLEWAKFNRDLLVEHELYATGTTGTVLEESLGMSIIKLQSAPLGGDQQIGAKIAGGEIDLVIFFWDPLEPQPHDPDVKALLRIAVVWNIPVACNRASADFMISSALMSSAYERRLPDYEGYRERLRASRSV